MRSSLTAERPAFVRVVTGLVAAALVALTLPGCADGTGSADPGSPEQNNEEQPAPTLNDFSLEPAPDIAAMVPEEIREAGVLRVGLSSHGLPGSSGHPGVNDPGGFDFYIGEGLAAVMGLEGITPVPVSFRSLLLGLGSQYEIAAAGITATPERVERANFIAYAETGSVFLVKRYNPERFDFLEPCGAAIAVQSATVQDSELRALSGTCLERELPPIDIQSFDTADEALGALADLEVAAVLSDALVARYMTTGRAAVVSEAGPSTNRAPVGVAIPKDDPQLTVAVQAAMQVLMDSGYVEAALAEFGLAEFALSTATIHS